MCSPPSQKLYEILQKLLSKGLIAELGPKMQSVNYGRMQCIIETESKKAVLCNTQSCTLHVYVMRNMLHTWSFLSRNKT